MEMHIIQQNLLKLAQTQEINKMSLRDIGKLIGVQHPQIVKHHIEQLQKKKLLALTTERNLVSDLKESDMAFKAIINIPILGDANCGLPVAIADGRIQGYLPVSKSSVPKIKDVFALRAVGNSMNKAQIEGKGIDDGDYIIVDSSDRMPENNKYVVSIIDGAANVKKLFIDKENNRFVLWSESTEEFPPIFIQEEDMSEYMITGKVIKIIKKFTPKE